MPAYHPITDIVPLASMVTGQAVSSSLLDQMRDNLVALYNGWWFIATGGITALTAATITSIPMTSITLSATATAEGCITLVSGSVQILKPGIWLYVAHISTSGAPGTFGVGIDATSSPSAELITTFNDGTSPSNSCCTATTEFATSDLVTLRGYSAGGVNTEANSRSPYLTGVFLGDSP